MEEAMNGPALRDALLAAAKVDLRRLLDVLRDFQAIGGTRDDAYQALESIRERADEAVEDVILEAMDFVVGFCAPDARIWPD
ncbi:hypothetical protein ACVBEQ_24715 [Nakamurella sp. GG22]